MRCNLLVGSTSLVCLIALSSLPDATVASSSPASLAQAERALEKGKFSAAARLYAEVASRPDLSAAERGRAWRGKMVAHQARHEDGSIQAAMQAVLAAPEHPSSPGLLALLSAAIEQEGCPSNWGSWLSAAKAAAASFPEVHSRLLTLEAQGLGMQGHFDAADSVRAVLAPLTSFLVIGPFEDEGGSGLDEVYAPEAKLDPQGVYRDLRGCAVSWFRAVPASNGRVDLGVALGGSSSELGYAWTHVYCDVERDAVLHLNTPATARLWLGAALVLDEPEQRTATLGLYEIPVHVEKGWNSILLKLGGDGFDLSFHLRLSDPAGVPLHLESQAIPNESTPNQAPALVTAATGDTTAPAIPRGLERLPDPATGAGWLRRWIATVEEAPLADQVLLVRYLGNEGFEDDVQRVAEVLQKHHRGTALAEDIRATILMQSKPNEALPIRRALHKQAPELLFSRLTFFHQLMGEGSDDRAEAELRTMRRDFPSSKLVAEAWVDELANHDKVEAALAATRALYAARPRDVSVIDAHRGLLSRLDHEREAQEALVAARQARPDQSDYALELAREAVVEERHDDAIAEYRAAIRAGSAPLDVLSEIATTHVAAGRIDSAAATLQQALRLSPRNSSLRRELGQLYLNHGREREAIGELQRALELEPGDFATRETLRELTNAPPERDLFPKVDITQLTRQDLGWAGSEANAVQLLYSEEVVVHSDGSSEHWTHIVTRILNKAGAEAFRKNGFACGGQAEIARIVKPDGREMDAAGSFRRPSFEGVEAGDWIEVRTRSIDEPKPGFPEAFWFEARLQDELPCLVARFVLLVPRDVKFTARVHNAKPKHRVSRRGEWRLETWEAREVPGISWEPLMPPRLEAMAWVDVSSVDSWNEIVRWYDSLTRNRTRVTPRVQAIADSLAAIASSDSGRIHQVASFVKTQVRYGDGSSWSPFVPQAAATVLRDGEGDCKDQTTLVIALLRALGIEARFALVNARSRATVPFLPSARFSHAIAQVRSREGQRYWIDPTANVLEFPNVPSQLEGVPALVVDPSNPQFCTIDTDSPSQDASSASIELTVAADGSLLVQGRATFQGERAAPYGLGPGKMLRMSETGWRATWVRCTLGLQSGNSRSGQARIPTPSSGSPIIWTNRMRPCARANCSWFHSPGS